jgi:hypothetical protein
MTDDPTPGSHEAVRQGCTCSMVANNNGRGIRDDREKFWIDGGCPLHGLLEEDRNDD